MSRQATFTGVAGLAAFSQDSDGSLFVREPWVVGEFASARCRTCSSVRSGRINPKADDQLLMVR
jgi:hypothetical protein